SRRRHTRFSRDWSSDVCSSDLDLAFEAAPASAGMLDGKPFEWIADADMRLGPVIEAIINGKYFWLPFASVARLDLEAPADLRDRSEERRVGKECKSRRVK